MAESIQAHLHYQWYKKRTEKYRNLKRKCQSVIDWAENISNKDFFFAHIRRVYGEFWSGSIEGYVEKVQEDLKKEFLSLSEEDQKKIRDEELRELEFRRYDAQMKLEEKLRKAAEEERRQKEQREKIQHRKNLVKGLFGIKPRCPYCKSKYQYGATVCCNCGREVPKV